MRTFAILAATATTLPAVMLPAAAQDTPPADAFVLPEITLSAYQTATELGRTGATVEVVTRDELERAGTTRVIDYLTTLPGISASGNGGFGTQTTLRVRGLPGSYVKVLVDGIDVTDPSATQISFDPGGLMSAGIQRVEVLKGPQSALYGSEAIGGVISITTLQAVEEGTVQEAGLEYGSYNSTRANYSVASRGERHEVAATISRFHGDGFSAADENNGNTEEDGADASRFAVSGSYQITPDLSVGGAAFWQQTDADFDEGFPVAADGLPPYLEHSKSRARGARAFISYSAGAVQHELSVQRYVIDRELTDDIDSYSTRGERSEANYNGDVALNDRVTLAWGGTHSNETLDQSAFDAGFITNSAFGEAQFAATPDLDIAVSARYDHHSEFGSKNSGRVALAWRLAEGWILRSQIGTGFRAPSPYELYAPIYGNPDLSPESSVGAELGIQRDFANGAFARATLFQTRITDLIDYDFTTSTYAQVPGDSRTRGVELSAMTPLTDTLMLSGNFTYTDSEDADGAPLNRVPRRALNLRLEGDAGAKTSYSLGLSHVSGLTDRGSEMPTYTTVDAGVEYDLTGMAIGYLRIENLLDEEYQVVPGYGTSDRAAYVGVRAAF